jgi:hypothetical protein
VDAELASMSIPRNMTIRNTRVVQPSGSRKISGYDLVADLYVETAIPEDHREPGGVLIVDVVNFAFPSDYVPISAL